jgi:hypothetical protein
VQVYAPAAPVVKSSSAIAWRGTGVMFQVVDRIDGTVLWSNLHLLFWLSRLPFTTAWLDETSFARTTVIVYGVNLLLGAVAYYLVQLAIYTVSGGSGLRDALGRTLRASSPRCSTCAGSRCRSRLPGSAWPSSSRWRSSGSYRTDASSATSKHARPALPRRRGLRDYRVCPWFRHSSHSVTNDELAWT